MRKLFGYYTQLLWTALIHSWDGPERIVDMLAAVAYLLARYASKRSLEAIVSAWKTELLLAGVVLFVMVRLIAAPYRMHLETEKERKRLEEENERLRQQLGDRQARALAKEAIGALFRHGQSIFKERPQSEEAYREWRSRHREWLSLAQTELVERISEPERAFFLVISPVSATFLGAKFPGQSDILCELEKYLANLKLIYERI